ncbi:hypothetical protein VTO73DRAFT_12614 [Trametes versicolor]
MHPEQYNHSYSVPVLPSGPTAPRPGGILKYWSDNSVYYTDPRKDGFVGLANDDYAEDVYSMGGMSCNQPYLIGGMRETEDTPVPLMQDSVYDHVESHDFGIATPPASIMPDEHNMTYGVHAYARTEYPLALYSKGSQISSHQGESQSEPLAERSNVVLLPQPSRATDHQQWVIPQEVYAGTKGYSAQVPLRSMRVDVAVSQALDPERLAHCLVDPLSPGFPGEAGAPDRKRQKLTVRYKFIDYNRGVVWQNPYPRQINEYASTKRQSCDPFVKAAQRLHGAIETSREDFKSKPLMRIALVEIVARELQDFIVKLEAGDSPLTFRGIPVDFNHLRIVRIDRPTTATVQPVLEILSGYRYLYSRIAGVL